MHIPPEILIGIFFPTVGRFQCAVLKTARQDDQYKLRVKLRPTVFVDDLNVLPCVIQIPKRTGQRLIADKIAVGWLAERAFVKTFKHRDGCENFLRGQEGNGDYTDQSVNTLSPN